jgi:hypothetical protein
MPMINHSYILHLYAKLKALEILTGNRPFDRLSIRIKYCCAALFAATASFVGTALVVAALQHLFAIGLPLLLLVQNWKMVLQHCLHCVYTVSCGIWQAPAQKLVSSEFRRIASLKFKCCFTSII